MAGWSHNARKWIVDALIEADNKPMYSREILDSIREMRKGKRNNLSIRQIGSLCAAMSEVSKLSDDNQHGCLWVLKYRRVYNNKDNTKEHESEEE